MKVSLPTTTVLGTKNLQCRHAFFSRRRAYTMSNHIFVDFMVPTPSIIWSTFLFIGFSYFHLQVKQRKLKPLYRAFRWKPK